MARLIAKTPAEGLLPVAHGGCRLTEQVPDAITSVMPFDGQEGVAAEALGLAWPGPGETVSGPSGDLIWTGRGQAMLLGARPGAIPGAAMTDQSDAWAVLALDGEMAEAVLARLCPLDLRLREFPVGATARSMLGHMSASITRTGEAGFRILVFRSMARTAVHELSRAMQSVAAQTG